MPSTRHCLGTRILIAAVGVLLGCPGTGPGGSFDFDGDGWDDQDDCGPEDPEVHPGAADPHGDGLDTDCDGVDGVDLDGDGYPGNASDGDPEQDCDDGDATVHPGAEDPVGDDIDQDCDGADCFDADGDGYCVEVDDCDDADTQIHPGAQERCNGIDDDCDGAPAGDEADQDQDGIRICEGDCDDTDPSIHPGQAEICGNFADDDCDGTDNGCALAGDLSLATTGPKLTGSTVLAIAGSRVAAAGDVDGDGLADLLVGAPGAVNAKGRAYLITELVTSDLSLDNTFASYTGLVIGDLVGWGMSTAGDVNNNGRDDVLIGCPGIEAVSPEPGKVYLDLDPVAGDHAVDSLDLEFIGEADRDEAGFAVTSGDVDGDGHPDVFIGAPAFGSILTDAGSAYLVLGTTGGGSLGTADVIVRGASSGDKAGHALALGDLDGDGLDDLVIGAPFRSVLGQSRGGVYVVESPVWGVVTLATTGELLVGEAANDMAGWSLAVAGDLDGDGIDDLIVGAYLADAGGTDAGAAYLVLGPVHTSGSLGDAIVLLGDATDDRTGLSVDGAGDIDGDGWADLLVGAYRYDHAGSRTGAAYLLYGPVGAGPVELASADVLLLGEQDDDSAGAAVAGVGDVDGDGFGDLLVGAPQDGTEANRAGAAYLVYGGGM